jgi:hypothetical protein
MARPFFIAAAIAFGVFLVTWGLSSLAVDPENLLVRIVLYLTGIAAALAAIVLVIVGLVKRARARTAA